MKRLSAFLIIFLVINLLLSLVINSRITSALGDCACCQGLVDSKCGGYCGVDNWCDSGESEISSCYEEFGRCFGECYCVPEFSDYAGIAALIGAIIIPTLIYKFRKKK